MTSNDSQPHLGRIVFYRDQFVLGGHSNFSSFIGALDKEFFTPFFLLMSEKAPTNYCSLEVVFLPQTGMVNPLLPWVFLNKCSLSFSEETRQITLEASMNKLWFALQILGWGGTTFLIIWLFLALGDNPRDNILLLFAGLVLLQPIMIWRRDIRRFKQIRSFAGKQK